MSKVITLIPTCIVKYDLLRIVFMPIFLNPRVEMVPPFMKKNNFIVSNF